jgi:lysine-specific histone demethylase 1
VTRWGQDPYSLGSYSHKAVGSSPEDIKALAEPVGDRVYFAGEATSVEHPATVHGAYMSGQAAAEAIDEAFKSKKIGGGTGAAADKANDTTAAGAPQGSGAEGAAASMLFSAVLALVVAVLLPAAWD